MYFSKDKYCYIQKLMILNHFTYICVRTYCKCRALMTIKLVVGPLHNVCLLVSTDNDTISLADL